MLRKVLFFIRENKMIERGDNIVVGVSGGADSVCLLRILCELREELGHEITVVHIEHGIRGKDSIHDMDFVQELCNELRVEFRCVQCNIIELAKREKLTVEEAGRKVRYEAFARCLEEKGRGKIAIAHNKNDCAETVLFHMARGTGLKGMEGIAPVRDEIIRPLLCVERSEIEAYLEKIEQEYCTDATNADTVYARNRIRHEVLPALTKVNDRAVDHIWGTARMLSQVQEYMEQQADKIIEKAVRSNDSIRISHKLLKDELDIIKQMVVHSLLGEAAGSRKDITTGHINSVTALVEHEVGGGVSLPYGLFAENGYDELIIWKHYKNKLAKDKKKPIKVMELKIPGTVELGEGRGRLEFRRILKDDKVYEIPQKMYTKNFDYDRIVGNLQVRNREPGDYFVIDSQGRHQTLKKYLINEKIPANEREDIIVIADGQHILWAVGYRISEACKITEDTREILEVQFILEEEQRE